MKVTLKQIKATGTPSAATILWGDGAWREPVEMAPSTLRGEWLPGTSYDEGDVVAHLGSLWAANNPNTGIEPTEDSTFQVTDPVPGNTNWFLNGGASYVGDNLRLMSGEGGASRTAIYGPLVALDGLDVTFAWTNTGGADGFSVGVLDPTGSSTSSIGGSNIGLGGLQGLRVTWNYWSNYVRAYYDGVQIGPDVSGGTSGGTIQLLIAATSLPNEYTLTVKKNGVIVLNAVTFTADFASGRFAFGAGSGGFSSTVEVTSVTSAAVVGTWRSVYEGAVVDVTDLDTRIDTLEAQGTDHETRIDTLEASGGGGGGGGSGGGAGEPLTVNLLRLLDFTISGGSWQGAWTDGNTNFANYQDAGSGTQQRTIDLGAQVGITDLRWIFYYGDARIYQGVLVEVSTDGTTWTTVRASAPYTPTSTGLVVAINGIYRYVRIRSQGSDLYTNNEWVEVAVLGALGGGGGGGTLVTKTSGDGATRASTGDVYAEAQTAYRYTATGAVVGDTVEATFMANCTRTSGGAVYHDIAVVNPTTGAIIRRSAPGAYGIASIPAGDYYLASRGTFVVEAGDIVGGNVTLSLVLRSSGGLQVYGLPEYGWQMVGKRYVS